MQVRWRCFTNCRLTGPVGKERLVIGYATLVVPVEKVYLLDAWYENLWMPPKVLVNPCGTRSWGADYYEVREHLQSFC